MSSSSTPGAFDEAYDLYDPSTFTTVSRQRQQPAASSAPFAFASPDPLVRSPSNVSETSRTLRRTPRSSDFQHLQQQQLLSHRRAHSVDASGHHPYIEQSIPVSVLPASAAPPFTTTAPRRSVPLPPASPPEAQTVDEEREDQSTVDDSFHRLNDSNWPRRTTRVSPTTASAILWTLEEAFRKPFPFTTDWEEANASMSDMVGSVAGSTATGGPHGRVQNGAARGAPGPVPVPANPQAPSGMRTPTDIMRQRREREGRRRAEQEARNREQEEAERRRQQPEQSQQPPVQAQQPYAAGVDRTSQRRSTGAAGPRTDVRDPRTGSNNRPVAWPFLTRLNVGKPCLHIGRG